MRGLDCVLVVTYLVSVLETGARAKEGNMSVGVTTPHHLRHEASPHRSQAPPPHKAPDVEPDMADVHMRSVS